MSRILSTSDVLNTASSLPYLTLARPCLFTLYSMVVEMVAVTDCEHLHHLHILSVCFKNEEAKLYGTSARYVLALFIFIETRCQTFHIDYSSPARWRSELSHNMRRIAISKDTATKSGRSTFYSHHPRVDVILATVSK